MTKLQDAEAIYMGDDEALKVMLGATQMWAPPPDLIAPSYVQHVGAESNGSQIRSGTFGSATVSGNTIVVVAGWDLSSEGNLPTQKPTASDNKGNTYELVTSIASTSSTSGSSFGAGIFVAKNIVGGAGHQVTLSDESPGFSAVEISGASTTAPVADFAAAKDATSPFVAPAVDADEFNLVVAGMTCGGSPSGFSVSGFTNLNDFHTAGWWPTGAAYLRAPTGPTLEAQFSIPGGNTPALVVVVLKS